MNKEEFIGKLQLVYVGDRNAFNEIVEDNQKLKNEVVYSKVEIDRLNKEYERIYNENCKLRENHNINDITLLDENERLNNIINELEKWLEDNLGNCRTNQNYTSNQIYNLKEDIYYRCLDKLKTLKENNKDV